MLNFIATVSRIFTKVRVHIFPFKLSHSTSGTRTAISARRRTASLGIYIRDTSTAYDLQPGASIDAQVYRRDSFPNRAITV